MAEEEALYFLTDLQALNENREEQISNANEPKIARFNMFNSLFFIMFEGC